MAQSHAYEKMTAKEAKLEITKRRKVAHATLKEINQLIKCFHDGDFLSMQSTKLYQKHGAEYCELLEILN